VRHEVKTDKLQDISKTHLNGLAMWSKQRHIAKNGKGIAPKRKITTTRQQ
jgi:hypothetical protein